MSTSKSNPLKVEQEETTEIDFSGLDEISTEGVEVNIAIVGKSGSGRLNFVNAIRGLKESDENAARKGVEMTSKESISYSQAENPNLKFSILPSIDQETFPAFQSFLEYVEIEKFDVFLIFTAETFNKRHMILTKKFKSSNKPIFLIRTNIENHNHAEDPNEEKIFQEIKARLVENLKEVHSDENKTYLISNNNPDKWDFEKLVKAIADSLPSPQKECFNKIPKIQNLIAIENFQNFLKGVEVQEQIILDAKEIDKKFMESGMVGVQRIMNEKLERWKEVTVNLAILGNSGVGKSSFINAIRGVNDNHELAAETGIKETTRIPTSYQHPTNVNIRFWDLPGIGTPNYPDLPTFSEKVGIEKFDTFLIITARRFTKYDLQLAKKVESMGKSFFFVRTKIDNDRRSEKRKHGKKFNEEKMLKEIKNDCVECLENLNCGEEKVFLVSSYDPQKWDFDRLQTAIVDHLPSIQKESLALSLRTHSKVVLKQKIKILKGRVWMVAAVSVEKRFGFWPSSKYIDEKPIRDIVDSYRSQMEFPAFGSEEFKMLTNNLRRRLKRFYISQNDDLPRWLKSFDRANKYKIKTYTKYIVTNKPLPFIYYFLNLILDEMETTALDIIDEMAKKACDVYDDDD